MATPLRVLILEDRASDADLMLHELRRAGFQPEWERVEAKGEFLLHLNSGLDVILADFRMPQFDAPSALRLIQERGLDIPFIVVSGTIGEDVAVSMMREGATDYLLKDRLARLGQAVTRALEQKQLQQEKRQAEEAMRESEKLYRTLVETAPDAVTMTDLEGRITFASQKTLDLHGFDRLDEVLGRNAFDLIAPEDHEKAMLNLEKTLQEGVVANCEYIFLRKDGTRFQGGLNASMIRNGSGEPNGFIATTADISERKGVQRRDRLLQAASQMLTASAEAGEASRGLLRAICENLDWDRGELWGVDRQAGVLRCVGSWHNSSLDLAQFEAITEETAFAPGVGLPGRVWVTGEPAWISDACLDSNSVQAEAAARMGLHAAFAFPIRFGSELLGVMAVFNHEIQEPETDLMEMLEDLGTQIGLFMKRKRMEEEVRHQATLLRNIQDAVISTDMDFMIESWNEAAEEMYGWKAEEALGRPLGELFHGEYPIEPPEYAPNGFLENGHFEGEVIHCRKDGSPLNVLTSVSLLRDDEGEPVGAVAVNRDITELKRVEEKLRKALGDAKRSNEELEQFAYIASHDLQEPLRQVVSYLQLIELRYKGKLDAEADEFIGFAVQGALRMQRMIEDLLTYSRAGARAKPRAPIDLEQVFNHVLAEFKQAIEASGANVTWDALPKVNAEQMVMGRLFRNLVGNALKFKGAEPPEIHIGAERGDKEWRFSVQDNGIGINPKYFDRIFAIFDRLHSNQEYPGTGIGLALCKRIVQGYGGRIWVDSEPGAGSTFSFTIPDRDLGQGKRGASSVHPSWS